jgi:hypothetical protein
VLEVPHAYPGKWWTWQEFEKWFKQQSHGYLGRHTGRVAKAAPREMATEVMRNIVTWADKHPMASDEGFAGVSFGLAGTEAYAAEIEDMSKPPSYFNLGRLGLYSIYPQWTARQCTARYLQRVAQEFATPVSSHILAAAQQYESAYAAWQEWETHLGRLGPRGKAPENAWESEEHRKAGAAAVRQALAHEKAAIAELAKALELLH